MVLIHADTLKYNRVPEKVNKIELEVLQFLTIDYMGLITGPGLIST